MATSPTLLNPGRVVRHSDVRAAWIPIVFAMAFVAFTSTTLMAGAHTQVVVEWVWKSLLGSWHLEDAGTFGWTARKVGHFFGYGMIGLLFRKAWYTSIRGHIIASKRHIMLYSAALGVVSTFALASIDEWHQTYLPLRHGSIYDALLDAAGALFLNTVMLAYWTHRRAKMRGYR